MSTDKESSAAGTDNRPPMLVESDYESWKIRIERYIRGKPLGKLIWRSIQNGPTPHPQITVTEGEGDAATQVTRDKRDEEFTEIENNKELADIQATNILSQGLPRHVFNILNQTRTGKEIWDNVALLMKGSGKPLQQQKEELFDEYERFHAIGNESIHDYFVRFHKLINDMKITQLNIPTHQMNTKFVNNLPPYWAKYVTNVKNNKDISATTYVELYTYLKSYEPHAMKTLKKQEQSLSIIDPLAYMAQATPTTSLPPLSTSQPQPALKSSSNSRTHATVHDGQIVTESVQRRAPGNVGNTGSRGNQSYGNVTTATGKKVICYNCRGEGHVARQCKEPKRAKDSQYFKDKMLLMEAKEKGVTLDAEAEAFLANVECTAPYDQPLAMATTNIFEVNHEDAYDSDVDEGPNAAAAFMANLSSISGNNHHVNEVHPNVIQINDSVNYQLSHEMHHEEQSDSDVESKLDDNTTPYHQLELERRANVVRTEVSTGSSANISMVTILDEMRDTLDEKNQENQDLGLENQNLTAELAKLTQRNERNAELEQEKVMLKTHLKSKDISIEFLKSKNQKVLTAKKKLEDKYLDEIVCLKSANKVATDLLQKFQMPTHTIPMLSKKPRNASQDLHKDIIGRSNPRYGKKAPVINASNAWGTDETLASDEVSMAKMKGKPGHVRPESGFYEKKLKALKFVSQQELSREQVYWLPANEIASQASALATPVTPYVPKKRTTVKPLYVSLPCYEYAKEFALQQVVPFLDYFKKHVQTADDTIVKEVAEFKEIYYALEDEYEHCVLENKNLIIEKKNLLIKNDSLIVECLERDICSIVLYSDVAVTPSSNCSCDNLRLECDREHNKVLELEAEISKHKRLITESEKRFAFLEQDYVSLQLKFQNYKQCSDTSSASNAIFEINKLRDQLQGKDATIRNLDARINIMKVLNVGSTKGSCDQQALDTDRIQLKNMITSLRIQLDGLKVENVSLKRRYDELSKANTHSRTAYTEKLSALTAEHTKLQAQVTGKTCSGSTAFEKPKVLASGIYTNSSKYVPLPKRANWIKPTPLPKKKQVTFQEPPRTSNRPTQKPPVQQNKKPNVPVNLSTRTKLATESRKPIPKSHTQNHHILPSKSVNARRAADHNRKLNFVDHNQFVIRSLKSVNTKTRQAKTIVNHTKYALTSNPTIYDSLVKQFWQTATANTKADGSLEINATIDTIGYTITEASIRDSLQLEDATGITMLPNDEIFEGMGQMGYPTDGTFTFWKGFFTPQWRYLVHHLLHCISSKSGGWDQFGSNIATALICLSTDRVYNFSKLIFDGMVANLKSKTKFLMYPRFLQMILNIQTENKHLYLAVTLTKKIFGNMKRGFRGAPRPLLPAMLLVATTNPNAGQEHHAVTQSQPSSSTLPVPSTSSPPVQSPPPIPASIPTPTPIPETEPAPFEHTFEEPSPVHQHFSPPQEQAHGQMTMDDLLQVVPQLISRIDSLETDLKQTKLTMGNALVKLVKKVKKLEGFLKRRNVVLSDSEEEEPEAQGRKSQDDPLDSSVQGLVTPSTTKPRSIDKGRRYKRRKEAKEKKVVSSLDFQEEVDTGAEQVNTAKGFNTGQSYTCSAKRGQEKLIMISEDTPKKSKE
ncbi:uncharacterized mitochondrial protein-like protein [Tanacetum coccineum]